MAKQIEQGKIAVHTQKQEGFSLKKKLGVAVLPAALFFHVFFSSAQTVEAKEYTPAQKAQMKEMEKQLKQLQKELDKKIDSKGKKEAKRIRKEAKNMSKARIEKVKQKLLKEEKARKEKERKAEARKKQKARERSRERARRKKQEAKVASERLVSEKMERDARRLEKEIKAEQKRRAEKKEEVKKEVVTKKVEKKKKQKVTKKVKRVVVKKKIEEKKPEIKKAEKPQVKQDSKKLEKERKELEKMKKKINRGGFRGVHKRNKIKEYNKRIEDNARNWGKWMKENPVKSQVKKEVKEETNSVSVSKKVEKKVKAQKQEAKKIVKPTKQVEKYVGKVVKRKIAKESLSTEKNTKKQREKSVVKKKIEEKKPEIKKVEKPQVKQDSKKLEKEKKEKRKVVVKKTKKRQAKQTQKNLKQVVLKSLNEQKEHYIGAVEGGAQIVVGTAKGLVDLGEYLQNCSAGKVVDKITGKTTYGQKCENSNKKIVDETVSTAKAISGGAEYFTKCLTTEDNMKKNLEYCAQSGVVVGRRFKKYHDDFNALSTREKQKIIAEIEYPIIAGGKVKEVPKVFRPFDSAYKATPVIERFFNQGVVKNSYKYMIKSDSVSDFISRANYTRYKYRSISKGAEIIPGRYKEARKVFEKVTEGWEIEAGDTIEKGSFLTKVSPDEKYKMQIRDFASSNLVGHRATVEVIPRIWKNGKWVDVAKSLRTEVKFTDIIQ